MPYISRAGRRSFPRRRQQLALPLSGMGAAQKLGDLQGTRNVNAHCLDRVGAIWGAAHRGVG